MEPTSDKVRALLASIGVHVLCVLLMFIGLAWTSKSKPISVAGPVIEATLVDAPTRPAAARPNPQPPKPVPKPMPPPPEPEPITEPEPIPPRAEDTVDQERIDREALEVAENAEREQEERRKREQLLLEEQERLAAVERERQQQLEDIRRQREEAEKQRRIEEQRMVQLEDQEREQQRLEEQARMEELAEQEAQQDSQQAGNEGTDTDLAARYAFAIQTAVTQAWLRPDNVQQLDCRVNIIQIPGGEVISAEVQNPCAADEITRRSMEAAVMRANPLPYAGYETVFQRQINFRFCYPRTLCQ